MKKLFALMAVLVLSVSMALAVDPTTMNTFKSYSSGNIALNTYAQDKGTLWDWPDAPVAGEVTATVNTYISNNGNLNFEQGVTSYGTGLQYPNTNSYEWSMVESQTMNGAGGNTFYDKDVWVTSLDINHNTGDGVGMSGPWYSDYVGSGMTNTPSEYVTYGFSGDQFLTFEHTFGTSSSFSGASQVFVNPF